MHMVRHKAIGLDGQAVLRGILAQQIEIVRAISIREEDILAAIATLSDVMRAIRNDYTSKSRHEWILTPNNGHVNTEIGERPQ